jgi:glyoxylase-like metal-dependent hydrolase (beta-lactamase superfamily II)
MLGMNVKSMVLGELSTNCYILQDDSDAAVIIDPGDDANHIQEYILSRYLNPYAILLTHGHLDHLLAAQELSINFQIPIYMSEKDKFLTDRMEETAKQFTQGANFFKPVNIISVRDKDLLKFGNMHIKIIGLPGHTPGSVGYCIDDHVFTGDLVFDNRKIGEYRHKYSSFKTLMKSIEKLKALESKIMIYPGHGDPFSITDLQ